MDFRALFAYIFWSPFNAIEFPPRPLCNTAGESHSFTPQVKHKIRERLDQVCGGGDGGGGDTVLTCNVAELEAICREVRADVMVETNEIFKRRRKKRGAPVANLTCSRLLFASGEANR